MLITHQIHFRPDHKRVVLSNMWSKEHNVSERVLWGFTLHTINYNQNEKSLQLEPRSHSLVVYMLITHQIHFWPERKRVVENKLQSRKQNVSVRVLWDQYFGNNLYNHGNISSASATVAFPSGLYANHTPDSFLTGAQTSNSKQFAKQKTKRVWEGAMRPILWK